jgi:hypothetical protein
MSLNRTSARRRKDASPGQQATSPLVALQSRGFERASESRLRIRFAAVAFTLVIAGCSTQPSVITSEPNVPPTNYRAEILAYLRTYLNDPVGVRDAAISEPALRPVPGAPVQRYVSCLRYNAKNSLGKYEGRSDRLVIFLSGRFDTMAPARGEACASVTWMPFPELEQLRR